MSDSSLLITNAGNIAPTPLLEITPEQWDEKVRTPARNLLVHGRDG
jgi:hypothetical protein